MMKCHGRPNEVVFFVRCVFVCGVQLMSYVTQSILFNKTKFTPYSVPPAHTPASVLSVKQNHRRGAETWGFHESPSFPRVKGKRLQF